MNNILRKLVSFLPYLFVFVGSLYSPNDPDLGWHLKYGEYFWQHGAILRDNTFSTLMPAFHWANGSWGTDVITYATYHFAGFLGLSILSALVVTATFYFVAEAASLTVWDRAFLFPLLLYLEQPINAVSFRGQQVTLAGIALLFWIISRFVKTQKESYQENLQKNRKSNNLDKAQGHWFVSLFSGEGIKRLRQKPILLTIPLFFAWANVHEEFVLGLALYFIWIVFYMGQKIIGEIRRQRGVKRINSILWKDKQIPIIFFLSCLVTVINPFGIGVHLDALSHFGSPLLKDISEYLPFVSLSKQWWNQVVIAVLVVLSIIFYFFNGNLKRRLPFLGVAVVVYLLSFSVRRYAWPAYYLTIPLLTPLPEFFRPDSKKALYVTETIFLLVLVCLAVFLKQPFRSLYTYSWNDYCHSEFILCSPESAAYIQSHHLTTHLYTLYGWGGWLIWRYPAIKPTIDGRMHLWRDANGYSGFADYYGYEQNLKEIDDSQYNIVYMSPDKPLFKHMNALVNLGKWQLVYRDKYASVFVRS